MIYNVQALRAWAATIVMFVHLETLLRPLHDDVSHYLVAGQVGVDLFFVISGFVMVHTMRRKPVFAGAFFLNRIIRVVPLYWLLTLAVFAIAIVMPSLLQATSASPAELVRSLLFIPFVKSNGLVAPVLFVGWTLNYEMFFYLLFTIAIALTGRRLDATVSATIAMIFALNIAGQLWHLKSTPWNFFTSSLMFEFAFGILLGWLQPWRAPVPVRWSLSAGAVAMVALIAGPLLCPAVPAFCRSGIPAAIIVWAAISAETRGVRLDNRWVQLVGAASYSLYLTHPFALQAFGHVSARIGRPVIALVLTPVALATAIVIAIIVHRLIERPMTDWLRAKSHHQLPVVEKAEPAVVGIDGGDGHGGAAV